MSRPSPEPSGLQIEVAQFFATPVAAVNLPDAAQRNEDLRRRILEQRDAVPSQRASNLGGWHSDRDIADWGGQGTQEVLQAGRLTASRLTCDREGRPKKIDWKIRAWANVNGPGDANELHHHPGAFWSGTYYVDDGGRADDDTLGGELELMDPRGPAVTMYEPALAFAGGGGLTLGAKATIRPRAGLLVLFPSWLQHAVRPYRGHAVRISIAFNLSL